MRHKYNRLLRIRKTWKHHTLVTGSPKVLVTMTAILEALRLKVALEVFSRTARGNYSRIISRHCWLASSTAIFSSLWIPGSEVSVARFGSVVQCRTMRHEGKSVVGPGECLWFPDNRVCVAPPFYSFF